MAFYCKCGHTRGKHENPQKDTGQVGKCNLFVAEGVKCGCQHYVPKSTRLKDMKDYQKMGFMQLFLAIGCMIGVTLWIQDIEESMGFHSVHIGAIVAGILCIVVWWVKFGESFIERMNAECLE